MCRDVASSLPYLGRIHLSRYEFEDAKEHLDAFMKLDVYKSSIILKETRDMLNTIKKAIPYYDNPDDYEVERLPEGINTIYSEISPAFFNGHEELVFASNKNLTGSFHEEPVYTIYHSVKEDGEWTAPSAISTLGTFEHENAKIEIINEDNRLYMYSPQNGGDLIYSEYRNESWSPPKEFDQSLRDRYIENHFFIMLCVSSRIKMRHMTWFKRCLSVLLESNDYFLPSFELRHGCIV